jgi:hypothetical protein
LQAFSLIVTAEPYFLARQPSELVILENEVREGGSGQPPRLHRAFLELLCALLPGTIQDKELMFEKSGLSDHRSDSAPESPTYATKNSVSPSCFARDFMGRLSG